MNRQESHKVSSSGAKEIKSRIISELQDKFAKAVGVVFTDYKGLTVQELTELRRQLKTTSMEYKIVKNTLARKAVEGTPLKDSKDSFTGTVGVAVSYNDPILLTKKILEFVKTNEKLRVKGGVIEGKIYKAEDLKAISALPSRQTLLAMFIGTMQSPLTKLAGALNATLTQFAYAMEALKQKRESS